MALNESVPNASSLLSELDDYSREEREAINDLIAEISGELVNAETISSVSNNTIAAGTQSLQVKLISINCTVQYLSGGHAGQIVLLKLTSGVSVTFSHSSAQSNGDIYLNGGSLDLDATADDLLALVNIGGDPDTGVLGYWRELFRTLWS